MTEFATIEQALRHGAGSAPAIGAPERQSMDFDTLRGLVAATVARLNGLGIGRNDRVAIVCPNGPNAATGFLAIGAGAATAPLNPAYRADEYEFYLSDLNAKALVIEAGLDNPAIGIAQKLGVPIIDLVPDTAGPAGGFTLEPRVAMTGRCAGGFSQPDDIALVLHTSGTTSRPKIVPLAPANICATARHVGATLRLTPEDRCLNIMPLFHIHGLMAATLSSLAAGASVICTPGFNALKFFAWLDEVKPTWYTAVPTMHQAILTRAARNQDIIARSHLRFIRSSSSSLPPQVLEQLEATFHCPVVEAYGMTEAAHQMASNPLPPGARKPGSVGIAAGPEISIMDEAGNLLPPGGIGEVVIRGPNVTRGYENNPKANDSAFTHGWFRTGDQGVIDEAGYLSLTGRLKELINRGGEKISPREVDEILLDHEAVEQALTFALPHDMLGEDVGAVVVLREGKAANERELREFCARRLADFKVPRKIVFLAEIPKGATGKLMRIGLAEKLGLGK
ncbi:MAG TPA: acyl--CoA ligase [Stellaceae bacterium]|nr:acyl--CoA ligase [Stellaceae bacterium]